MTSLKLNVTHTGSRFLVTSPDVPGLYVAHESRETALSLVEPTIKAMNDAAERRARARAMAAKAACA